MPGLHSKTLSQKETKLKKEHSITKETYSLVSENRNCEALSSNPSTAKKKKSE
jgi:hypothetical protein